MVHCSVAMEALYPSLEAERSGLLREMMERSMIKIQVDEIELKLYLASTMGEDIKEEGWEEFEEE